MSFCAEPAAAGKALTRTLRINAKLAAFNFISPFIFLFSLFSVALLPVCCINYREQLLSQYDKQRNSANHVSTSQKSSQLLYWWENRRSEWSTKQLSKGFGPMLWGRNCGAFGCARA